MPLPGQSIYTPYDSRYQNPGFNQLTGQQGYYPGTTIQGLGGSTGAQSGSSALPNYNSAPGPTSGQGAYGLVPGTIGIPPNTFQQATGVAPGLANTNQLTSNIMAELEGDINKKALTNMQDAAASYGVSSGMPGSNAIPGTLAFNKNLRNIGLDTLAVQRQGQQDYLSALQGIGGTQTPQGLAAEIAAHNAQLKAAPDPASAAQQQLQNYWNALNALRGPGGGTGQQPNPGAGTGTAAPGQGALGFGFGSFGQGAGGGSPYGGGQGGFGSTSTVSSVPGATLDWAGAAPTDLFGDLGAPTPGFGNGYNASTDQSTYDPYSQWNPYGGYDQSAAPTIPDQMTNADYFDYMGAGA